MTEATVSLSADGKSVVITNPMVMTISKEHLQEQAANIQKSIDDINAKATAQVANLTTTLADVNAKLSLFVA